MDRANGTRVGTELIQIELRLANHQFIIPLGGIGGSFVLAERSAKLRLKLGALDRTRTYDPQLRKLMLYPLSYERVKVNYTGKRVPFFPLLPLQR